MAQGALKGIRLSLLRAIQLAACRPYDALRKLCTEELGKLCTEEPPNYIRWKSSPLYKLAVFSHPMFLSFVDKTRVTHNTEAAHQIAIPGLIRNEEVERVVTECGPKR
jgi:hypothetical protein